MSFVHLHGHSTFSFLEAIGKPNKILTKAKELEMPAIAITDYNGMYCAVKFYQTAKEEWIKPIIWVELWFVLDINSTNPNMIWNIVIIAQNQIWYESLMRLVWFANKEGIQNKPKTDLNQIKINKDGIILICGGTQSWINKMLTSWEKEEKINEILNMLIDIVGKENLFLEITAQDEKILPEVKKINNLILNLSEKNWLSITIANNYHYISKSDKEAREVALAIKDGKKIYDENRRKPKWDFHIMSRNEIEETMEKNWYSEKEVQSWIEKNLEIAEKINTEIELNQALFPNYESPEDIKELYEEYKDKLVI